VLHFHCESTWLSGKATVGLEESALRECPELKFRKSNPSGSGRLNLNIQETIQPNEAREYSLFVLCNATDCIPQLYNHHCPFAQGVYIKVEPNN